MFKNPKEFWKIIKKESSIHSQYTSSIVFRNFIEHFKKLNKSQHFEESVLNLLNTSANEDRGSKIRYETIKSK